MTGEKMTWIDKWFEKPEENWDKEYYFTGFLWAFTIFIAQLVVLLFLPLVFFAFLIYAAVAELRARSKNKKEKMEEEDASDHDPRRSAQVRL